MTTTEKSSIFKDLFNECTLLHDLRSDMQLDLKQKTQIVQNTEFWVQSKNGKYESIDPADLNFVYNQLVARFTSVFCSNLSEVPVTYNTNCLRQGVREYIALGPKDIGRLGCFWMTDEMLGLFDRLFMVCTFRIAQPNTGLPIINALQYNDDELIPKYSDTNLIVFSKWTIINFFHWEFNSFFSGWHYDTVLLKHDKNLPCFVSVHHYPKYCIR